MVTSIQLGRITEQSYKIQELEDKIETYDQRLVLFDTMSKPPINE